MEAALKGEWEEAIELNQILLEKDPKDLKARLRLGKAYMQTKDFSRAITLFNEVLKVDPINTIAKRNLEDAKSKKISNGNTHHNINQHSLIKEPGTTVELRLKLDSARLTGADINPGEVLSYKILKLRLDVIRNNKIIATVKDKDLITKLNKMLEDNIETMAVSFKEGKDKDITIIIKTSKAIFKAEKQELRPYVKKGSIDEPELELGDGASESEEES